MDRKPSWFASNLSNMARTSTRSLALVWRLAMMEQMPDWKAVVFLKEAKLAEMLSWMSLSMVRLPVI